MADATFRKRYAVLGVSSLILVAMVVAVTIGTRDAETDSYNHEELSASQKAAQTICAPTEYKETCMKSLSSVNSTDPKELIVAAFKITEDYLSKAAKHSTVLKELESDPKTKLALDNCRELSEHAVIDLQKAYDNFQAFDIYNTDDLFEDLQVWVSGAITYQETCLDGFENATGDAAEKMRKALNTSMELTSNGLAMITDVYSAFQSLNIQSFLSRRRLLSGDRHGRGAEFPSWVDEVRDRILRKNPKRLKPDLIVAKDGTGKYQTINEALKDIPEKSKKIFVLYIKAGVYEEKVTFVKNHLHLMIVGDGPTKTRITGSLNFIDGTPTYHTATVVVLGDFFVAKDIGFENSAGPEKHQAVALRVSADKVIFFNCHMDGYQDTLYAHTYRQFYRNCKITGTIDFIFGDSAAVFQNCTMEVRKPLDNQQNIVTAQGRKDIRQPTGLVIQNCSFVAAPEYFPHRFQLKSYLGRPWKEFSRTIIVESFLDDLIQPEGWLPWNADFGLQTLFYTEFNNRGPAANKDLRVKWPGVKELPSHRIERFLASKFISGNSWIKKTGVPYVPGFIFPPPKDDPTITYSLVDPEEFKDLGKKRDKEAYKYNPDAASVSSFSILLSPSASPEPSPRSAIGLSPAGSPIALPKSSSSNSVVSWIMGNLGF